MLHSSTQQKTQANKINTLLLKENWTENVLISIYYLYSVLCNRIRYNCCCCCFWLIIQIIYIPANRFFSLSKRSGGVTILIMCTQCTLQLPETNTFDTQCILAVIIIIWLKKRTIIKLCFIFSHLIFYCYLFSFSFKILICCTIGRWRLIKKFKKSSDQSVDL